MLKKRIVSGDLAAAGAAGSVYREWKVRPAASSVICTSRVCVSIATRYPPSRAISTSPSSSPMSPVSGDRDLREGEAMVSARTQARTMWIVTG